MLSWITRSDKDCKITIRNREEESDDYPFVLYIGDYLSVMLTEDELSQLFTEVNESLFAFDFNKGKVNG